MKSIVSPDAPKVIGPYSPAMVHEGLVFTSGQIGIDPATSALVDGIEAQTEQVLHNLEAVLISAGSSKEQVIKSTIYVTDLTHYGLINQLYGDFFGEHHPARSAVEVTALPAGALIEIEMIAAL